MHEVRQWAVLEPLLPVAATGRPALFQRRLIDGVRHRVRTGAPWRDLPEEYVRWQTVYSLFRRWQREGVWAMLLTQLQARAGAAGRIIWDVSVDSRPPEAPPEPQLHTVMGGHSAGARICRRECGTDSARMWRTWLTADTAVPQGQAQQVPFCTG
jgi:transposase